MRAPLGLLAAAVVLAACGDSASTRRSADAAPPPPVTTVEKRQLVPQAPVRDECFGSDTTEASAMPCAAGAASRIADTLQILLSSGTVMRRVDIPAENQAALSYRYDGRIGGSSGGPAYHLLSVRSYGSAGEELINAQTGDSLEVVDRPAISPDGARFAVSDKSAMQVGRGDVVLQIWRTIGDRPVNELDLRPYDTATQQGWGPSHLEWRSADTLALVRNAVPRDSARRVRNEWDTAHSVLVRKGGRWVLDPRR